MRKHHKKLFGLVLALGMLIPSAGFALERPVDKIRDVIIVEGHPEPPIKAAYAQAKQRTPGTTTYKLTLWKTNVWIEFSRGTIYITRTSK